MHSNVFIQVLIIEPVCHIYLFSTGGMSTTLHTCTTYYTAQCNNNAAKYVDILPHSTATTVRLFLFADLFMPEWSVYQVGEYDHTKTSRHVPVPSTSKLQTSNHKHLVMKEEIYHKSQATYRQRFLHIHLCLQQLLHTRPVTFVTRNQQRGSAIVSCSIHISCAGQEFDACGLVPLAGNIQWRGSILRKEQGQQLREFVSLVSS